MFSAAAAASAGVHGQARAAPAPRGGGHAAEEDDGDEQESLLAPRKQRPAALDVEKGRPDSTPSGKHERGNGGGGGKEEEGRDGEGDGEKHFLQHDGGVAAARKASKATVLWRLLLLAREDGWLLLGGVLSLFAGAIADLAIPRYQSIILAAVVASAATGSVRSAAAEGGMGTGGRGRGPCSSDVKWWAGHCSLSTS